MIKKKINFFQTLLLLTICTLFATEKYLICAVSTNESDKVDKQALMVEAVDPDYKDPVDFIGVKQLEDKGEVVKDEEKKSYNGYQLWRVVLDDINKKRTVISLRDEKDISMWGGNTTAIDVLVRKKSLDFVRVSLEKNNINYEVVMNDVQKSIDEENPAAMEDEDELVNRQGHKMSWQRYHRLSDIHQYMDYLAETYPSLCAVQDIGKSVNNRPMKILKVTNGKEGNTAVWVDGGMHAREWISPATVTFILNQIVAQQERKLADVDFYFLPVANPDGYEFSFTNDRLWRKNRARSASGQCAGTDLNRNFGYKWGGRGVGTNPCQETYGGTGPFSEPETASIRNFITETKANWTASVSFHSYGQYILFPWGYDRVITEDYHELNQVANKAAQAIRSTGGPQYTVGPAGSTLYPAAGGSDDWAKGAMKINYAYTVELRDSGRHGFVLPANYIIPTAKEALAAFTVIVDAARSSRRKYIHEEYAREE